MPALPLAWWNAVMRHLAPPVNTLLSGWNAIHANQ
jgi:hypothetical protein